MVDLSVSNPFLDEVGDDNDDDDGDEPLSADNPKRGLSVVDWLTFPSDQDLSVATGRPRARSTSSADFDALALGVTSSESDLPPQPTEPAPQPPIRRTHYRSKSADLSNRGKRMGMLLRSPGTKKDLLLSPPRRTVKELQTDIQELKDRNVAVAKATSSLQDELLAVREDRIYLQQVLNRLQGGGGSAALSDGGSAIV